LGEKGGENPRRGFGSSARGERRKTECFYAEPTKRTSKTSQKCRGHEVAMK
jgi:hypothetical protein